jgi:DNA-binding MarR family transcriptional regulator
MTMDKDQLLQYLDDTGGAEAAEIADRFGLEYAAAAMALLRITRQGLARRALDPSRGLLWYRITPRGVERLAYLRSEN